MTLIMYADEFGSKSFGYNEADDDPSSSGTMLQSRVDGCTMLVSLSKTFSGFKSQWTMCVCASRSMHFKI